LEKNGADRRRIAEVSDHLNDLIEDRASLRVAESSSGAAKPQERKAT
jgi:hypothetical protein